MAGLLHVHAVGNELELNIDELNRHDRHAAATKVSGDIFGHVPLEFSKIAYACTISSSEISKHLNKSSAKQQHLNFYVVNQQGTLNSKAIMYILA